MAAVTGNLDARSDGVDLRATGLLWLINATVFHPRGFALAISEDNKFEVFGDGGERWCFSDVADWPEGEGPDDRFLAVEAFFNERRAQPLKEEA